MTERLKENCGNRKCPICSNINSPDCGADCLGKGRKYFVSKAPCSICGQVYESHVYGPSHPFSFGVDDVICHNPLCEKNHHCAVATSGTDDKQMEKAGRLLVSRISWNEYWDEKHADLKVVECIEEALARLPDGIASKIDKIYISRGGDK